VSNDENVVRAGELDATYQKAMSQLKKALLTENVGVADALLEEIGAMPIGAKTKDTLAAIAGLVLTSEFENAANMASELIQESFDESTTTD
jgi:hypothetical protein